MPHLGDAVEHVSRVERPGRRRIGCSELRPQRAKQVGEQRRQIGVRFLEERVDHAVEGVAEHHFPGESAVGERRVVQVVPHAEQERGGWLRLRATGREHAAHCHNVAVLGVRLRRVEQHAGLARTGRPRPRLPRQRGHEPRQLAGLERLFVTLCRRGVHCFGKQPCRERRRKRVFLLDHRPRKHLLDRRFIQPRISKLRGMNRPQPRRGDCPRCFVVGDRVDLLDEVLDRRRVAVQQPLPRKGEPRPRPRIGQMRRSHALQISDLLDERSKPLHRRIGR